MKAHTFDGRSRPRDKKTNALSQASFRRLLLAYDQHGRPYDGVIELRSNAPTGPIHPKFWAPIYPDPKYVIVNPENPAELYTDYPNWYRDRRQNEQEYYARAVRWAGKNKQPEPKRGEYSDAIEEVFGALNPRSSSLLVAAMYQENPWVIGACRGCSRRDPKTREFLPRFSHNCACPGGFTPFSPDPRLEQLVVRIEDDLPDSDAIEDFSIDAYAAATEQSVEEVAQRPTQFRRVSRRPTAPIDGPASLATEAERQTGALGSLAAGVPEMSEVEQENLDTAIAELETISDGSGFFSRPELESENEVGDEAEEAADPEVLGGRTVPVTPTTAERVKAQAPRQGNASTKRQIGAQRSAQGAKKRGSERAKKDNRPTLADGALPVIADE